MHFHSKTQNFPAKNASFFMAQLRPNSNLHETDHPGVVRGPAGLGDEGGLRRHLAKDHQDQTQGH